MHKFVAVAAVAAAFASTPAFAQSEPAPAAMSGPRIEATAGWDRIVLGVDGDTVKRSGVTYGGEIGYDIRTDGGLVLGAYAGADGASTKVCARDGTESACIKAGRNITAGVRAGGSWAGLSLFYVKGGYSNGELKVDYEDTAFPADNFEESGDVDGFHLGTGAEVGFSGNFYGKVEYNYTKYSTQNDAGFDIDFNRHRVVGGLGIRF
ncbi:porin family protein [Sphingomonas sp.]|jgi:outer membrane immunogenic protein|uniref:outer membrane protein n=1 Tax=Sphingomonas sp. TaxID=28214 RepID=UPI002D7F63F5|nr:porin family protein [Sphingomonas sp.]HEU0045779.1 porin family protein [Sphingomonas sp.]